MVESRASFRRLALKLLRKATKGGLPFDPADIFGTADASGDLEGLSFCDVCLRDVTLFGGLWAGDGASWSAYDLGVGTWWVEYSEPASGAAAVVRAIPTAAGPGALREARDWCIGQDETLKLGSLPDELSLYRGAEPSALRALCEMFEPELVEDSLRAKLSRTGESADDFEAGALSRLAASVRVGRTRRPPAAIPGLGELTIESASFTAWATATPLRWRDTDAALTEDTADRLRLVVMYLEAIGGAENSRIARHR